MTNFPRREIAEIVEIAKREPSVRSVFVEGSFDKDTIERYLFSKRLDAFTSVYSIDTIYVPDELVAKLGMNPHSNKSRVVALANEVSAACGPHASGIFCIVDADCDRELGNVREIDALCYTDFTCMEMYGFGTPELCDVFKYHFGLSFNDVREFEELMHEILPTLFALRCCNEDLNLNSTMPAISSGFEKRGNKKLKFDSEKYVRLFIEQGGFQKRRSEIETKFKERSDGLSGEIRNKAHGHDAVRLFYIFASRVAALTLREADIDSIGNRLLLGGLDFARLDGYGLFSKLLALSLTKQEGSFG